MIGIISKESEVEVVEEFFQLFKTPWEFYEDGKEYDVVIISKDKRIDTINAKVFLIFGHECMELDRNKNISLDTHHNIRILRIDEINLPIYTQIASFKDVSDGIIYLKSNSDIICLKIKEESKTFIRIGYNLFEEVGFLLLEGQPKENSFIPTLEIHIALLREWIVEAGIPLIEILKWSGCQDQI